MAVTHGQLLDRASDALRAASEAAGDTSASGHASVAATVAARTRAYQQLVRLVDQIGGPMPHSVSVPIAEQLVNSNRRLGATGPAGCSESACAPPTWIFPPSRRSVQHRRSVRWHRT